MCVYLYIHEDALRSPSSATDPTLCRVDADGDGRGADRDVLLLLLLLRPTALVRRRRHRLLTEEGSRELPQLGAQSQHSIFSTCSG